MLLYNTQGYTKCVFNLLQPFHRVEIWDIIIMDIFIFLCIYSRFAAVFAVLQMSF
jgi:hypothetical protein